MNFPASWDVEMNWEVNGSELRAEASFVYLIWNSAILRFRGVSDFIKPAWRFKNDSWQGRRFWAWGSACKLQRVTFWFGFLCILAWRLEFVLFFFLKPVLYWTLVPIYDEFPAICLFTPCPLYITAIIYPGFCVVGVIGVKKKTQDLMNNSHGITFFQVKVVMKIGLMYLTYYGNEPQVGKLGDFLLRQIFVRRKKAFFRDWLIFSQTNS